jgi:NADH-quinone oxidoreductase subunit L
MSLRDLVLAVLLLPLAASLLAGLGRGLFGRRGAHTLTILAVALAFAAAFLVLLRVLGDPRPHVFTFYTWMRSGGERFTVGAWIDRLSALMMVVVTFVSLAVHVYTIGYMHDDPGYARFFSYLSLFTFAMLLLVVANNLLELFAGWEGVGLVSYLLIGFWFERPSASRAAFKAFLMNRVGDLAFLLGMAVLFAYVHSLSFRAVFAAAPVLGHTPLFGVPGGVTAATAAALLLFVGASAKSAQIPLHAWLPDSMEGPTPISALIHAATMVTAGIYLVARLSPLFVQSTTALSVVLVVGALTAFVMGLLGIVATDIKRVIAYSTISQLGYMCAALGAGAFAAGIFHLVTHAFFKALLFLAAGSVILALHHEQDMRKMGGLRRYLPITYATFLVGALALVAFPGFSGFFSKDAIIDAVGRSPVPGAPWAYLLLLGGVFVTALYTFRMVFLVFHGEPRMDEHIRAHIHESPLVVTVPLIALAVPALLAGWVMFRPLLGGAFFVGVFGPLAHGHPLGFVSGHPRLTALAFALGAFETPSFWLMLAGIATAWYAYLYRPAFPERAARALHGLYHLLVQKYYVDVFYEVLCARAGWLLGRGLSAGGDRWLIDGGLVNGSAGLVGRAAQRLRATQGGRLYRYAFVMIAALVAVVGYALLT